MAFDPGGFSSEFGPGTPPPQPPPPPNFTQHGVLLGQGQSPVTATCQRAHGQQRAARRAPAISRPTRCSCKLVAGDLPEDPSAAGLGGVRSKAAVASQWLNSISTLGVPTSSQPSSTNLSDRDAAYTAFTPTVSVANLGDGVFSGVVTSGQYRRLGFLVWFFVSVTFTLQTYNDRHRRAGHRRLSTPPGRERRRPSAVLAGNPLVSPSDHLMGVFNSTNLLGQITTTAYRNNYWGPTADQHLRAGERLQAYNVYAGGVYVTVAVARDADGSWIDENGDVIVTGEAS